MRIYVGFAISSAEFEIEKRISQGKSLLRRKNI
jgi:hypothetical protein